MFTDEEKSWLEKCLQNPDDYTIFVDNDAISVYPEEEEGESFTFSKFGYDFALQLLQHIGCNAQYV